MSMFAKYILRAFLLIACFVCLQTGAGAAGVVRPDFKKQIEPLLSKYCYDCHGDGMDKGEVRLDGYKTFEDLRKDTRTWLAVWRNVDAQLMPPAKKAQPTPAERHLINQWIELEVFKLDPENPDPGRVTIRRLNREEYRNTIKDLFGVDYDTTDAFPADDTGYGFDTIGDVLNLSPLLLEKYLDAAQEIVAKATEFKGAQPPTMTFAGDQFHGKARGAKNEITGKQMPFANAVPVQKLIDIKHPGPYKVTVDMQVTGSTEATTHSAELVLKCDGKEIARRDLGWDNRKSLTLTTQMPLKKGSPAFVLEVVERNKPGEDENQLSLAIEKVTLNGPLDGSYVVYPKDYYRVFTDGPAPKDASAREAYARKILRYYADRAFRRPVDEPTLNRLVALEQLAEKQPGMNFEKGVAHALTAVLTSPRFLFRAEIQPEPNNPGKVVPVDEYALASRLSYFLWSSLPDEELFALARAGGLRGNLMAQVDRMLKDPKSQRFIRNFVGQWLQTRDVETINVDARRVLGIRNSDEANKIFSRSVRTAMREETEMFFDHVLKQNRSVDDMLTANYSFLNEKLADFYGIKNVKGSQMRKVDFPPGANRVGLLTHGSILIVTSNPTRTSPVKRGLFVLENLLGTPAPPAPPNVPQLEEAKKAGDNLTMRQLMEVHREKPLCASCHARMDPLGLALENFNALGMFRDRENGKPIDTAGELITGEKFNNIPELAKVLSTSRRKDFYRCLTEKLLTYATGRGPEYYDTVTIDKIVGALERDNGRMRTLLNGVLESAPFQKRRGDGDRLLSDRRP